MEVQLLWTLMLKIMFQVLNQQHILQKNTQNLVLVQLVHRLLLISQQIVIPITKKYLLQAMKFSHTIKTVYDSILTRECQIKIFRFIQK